jgi:hypothetical protein
MAHYSFEVENLGQFDRVLNALKELDEGVIVKEKKELDPFSSNFIAKILIDANYEDVLRVVSKTKNSNKVQDTIRPIH